MTPSPTTLLRLDGRDALDLLHRISTQHLRELPAGQCRGTLFCDFRGRVLHRAAVARTSDDSVWLLRPDAPGEELFAAIDKQIFRDQVRVEDLGARAGVVAVAARPDGAPGTIDQLDGVPTRVRLEGGVDFVIGAAADVAPLDEIARIRLGAPRHGYEVREDFNAFEVGLARHVHLDKGCFTGQEALLRMVTYHGVRRRLALIEGIGLVPAPNEALREGGEDAGVVTSVVTERATWTALAVVKRDAIERGAALATAAGTPVVRVTAFPDARPLGLPDPAEPAGR
jgi:tRNA-modifying protein YgfZ